MGEVDVSKIEYAAELVTENGKRWLLNDALISLQWEDNKNELAQRATLGLANIEIGETPLISLTKINCGILIYGKWDSTRQLIFQGTLSDWQYSSGSQKLLTVTAYDPLICLQKSKDFKYYTAGQSTQAILGDICSAWGVTLDYRWNAGITHEKKIFNGVTIGDMIYELLNEVKKQTHKKYIVSYRNGKLAVLGCGTNSPVYRFDNSNVISTNDKLSISNIVTQVKVLGKQDDDGRSAVEAIIKGDTKYGVFQEIVRQDSDKDSSAATAEGESILEERGKPERTTTVSVPDLPFLRKGDAVEMNAGNLIGIFYVCSVTHFAAQKKMTLTLEASAGDKKTQTSDPNAAGGGSEYADSEIVEFLGGPHWYASTSTNPTGGTRSAGTARVTNTAPGAPHPVHLIGVTSNVYGWVNTDQIKKK